MSEEGTSKEGAKCGRTSLYGGDGRHEVGLQGEGPDRLLPVTIVVGSSEDRLGPTFPKDVGVLSVPSVRTEDCVRRSSLTNRVELQVLYVSHNRHGKRCVIVVFGSISTTETTVFRDDSTNNECQGFQPRCGTVTPRLHKVYSFVGQSVLPCSLPSTPVLGNSTKGTLPYLLRPVVRILPDQT